MDKTNTRSYELVVIGGGPAGTSGAVAAGLFGHRVALVEKAANIGGAGLNSGTVPSKTLRETALALSGWQSRRLFGVDLSLRRETTVGDFTRHKDAVSEAERRRVETNLARVGVQRYHGTASFIDPHTIRVTGAGGSELQLHGERVLIATGSTPWQPPEFPFEDPRVHDSDELLAIATLPKRLVVVGAGVIGSEYASTFAVLGAEVHLVDGRDTLLPFLDAEISQALAAAMAASGVHFHWNERVLSCDVSQPNEVLLTLSSGATLVADGVLVCAGRSSNTGELNLPAAGITASKRGLLTVDRQYRTSAEHIYAAGDVIGPPALAATGMEQARWAVTHAFGISAKAELASLQPSGIYTIPEASMVGETEASLAAQGIAYLVGRARYCDTARGQIIGDEHGLLKLLFRKSDMRLLGVHVMGEHATDVVHIGLIAMLQGADAELFNRACFNYPTLGDLYKFATYDAILQRTQST
jgi:NAD(P) transhydrogenase